MASFSPDALRRSAEVVRDLHPPLSVMVKLNESATVPGLLLAWLKQKGGGWWGEVVVIDDGHLERIAIGAASLRKR